MQFVHGEWYESGQLSDINNKYDNVRAIAKLIHETGRLIDAIDSVTLTRRHE
jgi:hypothetical protein